MTKKGKFMRLVIQVAKNASVKVENETIGSIDKGFMVLVGVTHEDTIEDVEYLKRKLINLRVFTDENDKMNLSIKDINGKLLVISQFTLYADCRKGNRPSFINAARPEQGEELYNKFVEECKKEGLEVQTGKFGAHMEIEFTNDGPTTIIIDSKNA